MRSVTLPGTEHQEPIVFAFPEKVGSPHVINILCGQNNTGKSYLLEGMRECLHRRWAHIEKTAAHTQKTLIQMDAQNALYKGDVYVTMSSREPKPKILCFSKNTWNDIWDLGIVGLTRTPKEPPPYRINYHRAMSIFSYNQIASALENKICPLEEWLEDINARREVVKKFIPNDELYKCSHDKELIEIIEKILNAKLYFRIARAGNKESNILGEVEYTLAYTDGATSTYYQWSDGQRAIFYFFTLISEENPEILLLDEIENHLHPEYITEVLSFIKKKIPQSIITTHHPHVIFSELVDNIIYIESRRPQLQSSLPSQIRFNKRQEQSAPIRRIYTLENAFDKLTAVYQLFSHQDRQLLSQTQKVISEAEVSFYSALMDIFNTSIRSVTPRLTPDTQTKQLVDALKRIGTLGKLEDKATILDFGAGLGRVQMESSKLSKWQIRGTITWVCWEKDIKIRQQLKEIIDNQNNQLCKIIDKFDEIPDSSVDVCIFANVLHELTPDTFSDVICNAFKKINTEKGSLVILELFPLLTAEKYAVPYPPENLVRILRNLGFTASHQSVLIKDTSAYCMIAQIERGMQLDLNADSVKKTVEQEWEIILRDALENYAITKRIVDYKGYRDTIQNLTTIASIYAWRSKKWN